MINKRFTGRKHSEETKKKMSEWHKGRKHSVEHIRKNSEAKKGNRSAFWKGGKINNRDGYIYLYSPTHPFKDNHGEGYVAEHRLVMEAHIGRVLLPHESVHHINGIRNDNRIENLMLFESNGKHISFHNSGKNHPLYGKHHLEETKKKISKALTGKIYRKNKS